MDVMALRNPTRRSNVGMICKYCDVVQITSQRGLENDVTGLRVIVWISDTKQFHRPGVLDKFLEWKRKSKA